MKGFSLKLNSLKYGWADLSLVMGETVKSLYFEYVPRDTLFDLLESAIRIAENVDSLITFYNCSQRDYLSISKTQNGFCRIEIDNSTFEVPIKEYCKAVLRIFDAYIYEFSIDDFNDNWIDFPTEYLERLRVQYYAL